MAAQTASGSPSAIASSYATVGASYEMFFLNRLRQEFSRDTVAACRMDSPGMTQPSFTRLSSKPPCAACVSGAEPM
jgi:hypothetical protein